MINSEFITQYADLEYSAFYIEYYNQMYFILLLSNLFNLNLCISDFPVQNNRSAEFLTITHNFNGYIYVHIISLMATFIINLTNKNSCYICPEPLFLFKN